MAKKIGYVFIPNTRTKRPGVHSKNASKNQKGYKKKYRGQGKLRQIEFLKFVKITIYGYHTYWQTRSKYL